MFSAAYDDFHPLPAHIKSSCGAWWRVKTLKKGKCNCMCCFQWAHLWIKWSSSHKHDNDITLFFMWKLSWVSHWAADSRWLVFKVLPHDGAASGRILSPYLDRSVRLLSQLTECLGRKDMGLCGTGDNKLTASTQTWTDRDAFHITVAKWLCKNQTVLEH